jgi:uncharacterized protein
MLTRELYHHLLMWKDDPLRMPLILRGARQVGKTWLVREFGKIFDNFIELNFDWAEDARRLFDGNIAIPHIIENMQFYTK